MGAHESLKFMALLGEIVDEWRSGAVGADESMVRAAHQVASAFEDQELAQRVLAQAKRADRVVDANQERQQFRADPGAWAESIKRMLPAKR